VSGRDKTLQEQMFCGRPGKAQPTGDDSDLGNKGASCADVLRENVPAKRTLSAKVR
jgi:hypothetical protein